jgi:hypothetical protein
MPEFREEIKATVDAIRSKVGAEVAGKIEDDLISVVTKTNSISTQIKEQESEVKQLRAEAYEKRHALKNYETTAQTKFQEYEDKLKEYESKNKNPEQLAELERLRNFEKETIGSQKVDFKNFVETVKGHPKFEKVENKFKLPKNDKGIDFEAFEKMPFDELKHNISAMRDLKEIEYFDSAQTKNSPPPGNKGERVTDQTFAERIAAAKTKQDLMKIRAEYVK